MEFLSVFLPIILYIVAIILLIILIVLGIKCIAILDKIDRVVDNIEEKVNTFNGALSIIGKVSDGIASIGDSVIFGITSAVSKIFNKVKSKEENDYYE
ncbi:MAG: hypothetical protein HFE81_03335 [Bacilli bacterium]|nr:hypothetical protein [Bacilli bacterium]